MTWMTRTTMPFAVLVVALLGAAAVAAPLGVRHVPPADVEAGAQARARRRGAGGDADAGRCTFVRPARAQFADPRARAPR